MGDKQDVIYLLTNKKANGSMKPEIALAYKMILK